MSDTNSTATDTQRSTEPGTAGAGVDNDTTSSPKRRVSTFYSELKKLKFQETMLRLRTKKTKAILGAGAGCGMLFSFFGDFLWRLSGAPDFPYRHTIGAILLAVVFLGAVFVQVSEKLNLIELEEKKESLRARRILFGDSTTIAEPDAFFTKSKEDARPIPSSYFDRLVDINVNNLEAYYSLVKAHTNKSFLVSLTAGGIGFTLIAVGLIIGFSDAATTTKPMAYISAGSGVITEFIASVFFYLYSRTVRQLKEYHDSLLAVQNILLSFKIVGDTKDEARKTDMFEHMIECLITKGKATISGTDKAPKEKPTPGTSKKGASTRKKE